MKINKFIHICLFSLSYSMIANSQCLMSITYPEFEAVAPAYKWDCPNNGTAASLKVTKAYSTDSCDDSAQEKIGKFIRHSDWQTKYQDNLGDDLAKKDGTFCLYPLGAERYKILGMTQNEQKSSNESVTSFDNSSSNGVKITKVTDLSRAPAASTDNACLNDMNYCNTGSCSFDKEKCCKIPKTDFGNPDHAICKTNNNIINDMLAVDDVMLMGENRCSKNKKFKLILQSDGNLCIYQAKDNNNGQNFIWCNMKRGYGPNTQTNLVMQKDGNLVIYKNANRNSPVWATGTNGKGANYVQLMNNGNLIVSTGTRNAWASGKTGNASSSFEFKDCKFKK